MILKPIITDLLFSFAGMLFMHQENLPEAQKAQIRIDNDRQIGDDSKKGPPGMKNC